MAWFSGKHTWLPLWTISVQISIQNWMHIVPLAYFTFLLCPFHTMEDNSRVKEKGSISKCAKWQYLCPKMNFCAKRVSKIIVLPEEMLLSFSIRTFLSNYDVTFRKLQMSLIHSIERKQTKPRVK